MKTIVRSDNVATIPSEIAVAFGIKEGTRLEWTESDNGTIVVRPLPARGERARKLLGAGRRWLKPGQNPISELIRDRAAEDK